MFFLVYIKNCAEHRRHISLDFSCLDDKCRKMQYMASYVRYQKASETIGALKTQYWRDHCSMSSQNEGWASPWALKKGSDSVKRHVLGRKDGMWKNCKERLATLSTSSGTAETKVKGLCLKIKRDMVGQAELLDHYQAICFL